MVVGMIPFELSGAGFWDQYGKKGGGDAGRAGGAAVRNYRVASGENGKTPSHRTPPSDMRSIRLT